MTPEERDQWLDGRRKGVGASDAAAVAGLSRWTTPFGVYVSKVYGVDQPSTDEMSWGLRLEPVIAQAFAEQTGMPVSVPAGQLAHPDRPWQLANLDRVAANGAPVELKTSRYADGWGLAGTDQVPDHYLLQVVHQQIVTGADLAYLAALIGGSDFRVYTIRLDADLAARLTDIEAAFWDRVLAREAPEPDWSHPSTPELMRRLAVPTPNTTLAVPDGHAAEQWVGEYVSLGKTISKFQKERDAIKARIEHLMGTHSAMSLPDGTVVRRKMIQRAGYTVAPSSYPQLTVKDGDA